MSALLRFEGVTLRRGGRLLFENLGLQLGPGERLQVTGPNGSGKSSLIRLAAGLLRHEAGRIERAPLALADDARRARSRIAAAPGAPVLESRCGRA